MTDMYRLLLKIRTIRLRLKQQVDLQVFIKKSQQKFLLPQKAKLQNGIAILNAHCEFFVACQSPRFELFVMILQGGSRKCAGKCDIDLREWEENSSNTTVYALGDSPDQLARIQFQFMYLGCDVRVENRSLISLAQLQSYKKSLITKQIQSKNTELTNQNSALLLQIQALKKQNQTLVQNRSQLVEQYIKSEQLYQRIIKQKQMEMESSESNLCRMREKIMRIGEMVHGWGEGEMKERMERILMSDGEGEGMGVGQGEGKGEGKGEGQGGTVGVDGRGSMAEERPGGS